ncbi:MAG TPA: transcriptional regulator [Chthonomonadaceae bacterium]|nr:transcriptional regulator [Chthonomonadaceae bacterium]
MSALIEQLMTHPNAPQAADALEALGSLDDAFLQKARLGIMSTLLALGEADFKLLKEALSLSDGNLSTHLAVLEERGYVEVRKEFVRRKPHSTYSPSAAGREAFLRYLQALERIIRAADVASQPAPPERPYVPAAVGALARPIKEGGA